MTQEEIKEWLNSEPLPTEIRERDGAYYIPYHIVVEKLNQLCGYGNWDMLNFRHTYQPLNKGQLLISGSIEVKVNYGYISRILSGAANFVVNGTSNPHVAATVKSLAVLNAVKPLGKTFGWGLNGFEKDYQDVPEIPSAQNEVHEEQKIEDDLARLMNELDNFEYREDAQAYLESTTFKLYMPAKKAISIKPSRQKQATN